MTSPVFGILRRLDEARIHYFIERHRTDTIDITATVVGQRMEISVFEDGHVEVSRFMGRETIEDASVLDRIISREIADMSGDGA